VNLRLGPLAGLLAPGFSRCKRCRTPWKFVVEHATPYWSSPDTLAVQVTPLETVTVPVEQRSCFPLCEKCWQDLGTPAARLPFYRQLWLDWQTMDTDLEAWRTWDAIAAAVLAGR
jgi:hypothetical protein